MPEIDEIITVLKIEDNDALEAMRKLESTAKDARTSLEKAKDILVEIKDEVADPIDIEATVKEGEFTEDDGITIPVKLDILRPDEGDEPDVKEVTLDIADPDVKRSIKVDITRTESGDVDDIAEDEDDLDTAIPPEMDYPPEDTDTRIPFKEGKPELIPGETVQMLARERFHIENLEQMGQPGYSRTTYDLDDDKVLKVLYDITSKFSARLHIVQNLTEGLEKGYLPKLYERGFDYVVTEKLDTDYERAEKLTGDIRDKMHDMGWQPDEEDRFNVFIEWAEKVDAEHGSKFAELAKKYKDTVALHDLIAPDNIGFRDDVPVPLDPGGLGIGDYDRYIDERHGGQEQFDKDYTDKIIERLDKLRGQSEAADEPYTKEPYIEEQFQEIQDEIEAADDAEDEVVTPQKIDDEVQASTIDDDAIEDPEIIDPDEDIDSIDDPADTLQDISQEFGEGNELRVHMADIMSKIAANDFTIDDPNAAGVTEDDIQEIVEEKLRELIDG